MGKITGMEFLICPDDLEWRDQTESGEKGRGEKRERVVLETVLETVLQAVS